MSGRPQPPPISFNRLVRLLLTATAVVLLVRIVAGAFADDGAPAASPSAPSVAGGSSHSPDRRALPKCVRGDRAARPAEYADWAATLVDTEYGLRPSYAPPDLVSVQQAGFTESLEVRKLVVQDLAALQKAATKAGSPLGMAAAYRSYATQESLYRRRIQTEGHGVARAKTARPGYSEHQLGTTIDFKTAGAVDVDSAWEATPAGKWMAENAWHFGFVMSYPAGGTRQTCYWYEPWHYRYFGRAGAKDIHGSGLTVREYLWEEQP